MFYGMPIHIIRDVAITIRSFYKRITDFVRYRHATRDMNERYPDATAAEITREDVCIICREEMRPWGRPNQPGVPAAGADRIASQSVDERLRPKKLPCGHILHFACLRSWLERQQNCPTCRRPVLATGTLAHNPGQAHLAELARVHAQANQLHGGAQAQVNGEQPHVGRNRIRMFNLGPIRLGFGAGHDVQGLQRQLNPQQPGPPVNAHGPNNGAIQQLGLGFGFGFGRQPPAVHQPTTAQFSPTNIQSQLHLIEQELVREINNLRVQNDQLQLVRALQGELARLRIAQANPGARVGGPSLMNPYGMHPQQMPTMPTMPTVPSMSWLHAAHAFVPRRQQPAMGAGHQDLPPGLTLPEGWTMLPLQRMPSANDSIPTVPPSLPPNSVPDSHFSGNTASQQSVHTAFASFDSLRGEPVPPTLQPNPLHGGEESTQGANPVPEGNTVNTLAPTMPSTTLSPGVTTQDSGETQGATPMQSNGIHDKDGAVPGPSTINQSTAMNSSSPAPQEGVIPAPSLPASIPTWSSNETLLEGDQLSNETNSTDFDEASEGQSASTPISRQSKGKGRAATVEDYTDDVD